MSVFQLILLAVFRASLAYAAQWNRTCSVGSVVLPDLELTFTNADTGMRYSMWPCSDAVECNGVNNFMTIMGTSCQYLAVGQQPDTDNVQGNVHTLNYLQGEQTLCTSNRRTSLLVTVSKTATLPFITLAEEMSPCVYKIALTTPDLSGSTTGKKSTVKPSPGSGGQVKVAGNKVDSGNSVQNRLVNKQKQLVRNSVNNGFHQQISDVDTHKIKNVNFVIGSKVQGSGIGGAQALKGNSASGKLYVEVPTVALVVVGVIQLLLVAVTVFNCRYNCRTRAVLARLQRRESRESRHVHGVRGDGEAEMSAKMLTA